MYKKITILLLCIALTYTAIAQDKKLKITTTDNTVVEIPIKNNTSLSVDTVTGDVRASTNYASNVFCTDISGGTRDCSGGGSDTTPAVSLSTNTSSVTSGGSAVLTYTIGTVAATECIKSGGSGNWSGTITNAAQLSTTSHSVTVTNITSNANYSIKCKNNTSSYSIPATVTINVGSNNSNCPSVVTGPTGVTYPSIQRDMSTTTWDQTTQTPWPGDGYTQTFYVKSNQYLAIKFTTKVDRLFARWSPATPNIKPPQNVTVAISECPGVFNEDLGSGCYDPNRNTYPSYGFWTTRTNDTAQAYCKLQPNTEYYLNVINALDSDLSVSKCTYAECGVLASTNSIQYE